MQLLQTTILQYRSIELELNISHMNSQQQIENQLEKNMDHFTDQVMLQHQMVAVLQAYHVIETVC